MVLVELLAVACSASRKVTDKYRNEKFYKSRVRASTIIDHLPDNRHKLTIIKGTARVQVSQPGETERGTVYFDASRNQSLLTFKNGLGIEGGRLLITGDSVLVYNKIDHFARKMSVQSYSYVYLNGMAPVNPLQLLAPDLTAGNISRVLESPTSYVLVTKEGTQYYIGKKESLIRKISYPENAPGHYSTVLFNEFAPQSGMMLPRRIQIISSDRKSSIFLLIRSLDLNPGPVDFHINIPSKMPIERY